MEKGIYVKDILPDARVEGVFAALDPALKETRNKSPFWKLLLSDASGSIEAKIWSPLSEQVGDVISGMLVLIDGKAGFFNDNLQVTISRFTPLSPEELAGIDISDFTPASPYDREEMFSSLRRACLEEFAHAPWRALFSSVFRDPEIKKSFMTIPAAKKMHHAYAGGLLEHSLAVFRLCRSLCDLYPDLDRQTLLAGALFHDIGKIREFSGGLANDYTNEGMLIGHISLGLEILEPFLAKSGLEPELKSHLKHLILSHHGLHEYGAPCLPQTPEAFILHYADNMDAKMNQFHNLFETDQESVWSPYQSGLDRKIFKAFRTPGPKPGARGDQNGAGGQCLSLLKE